jgi:hypothetical protein
MRRFSAVVVGTVVIGFRELKKADRPAKKQAAV